jgi:hypothetical protein
LKPDGLLSVNVFLLPPPRTELGRHPCNGFGHRGQDFPGVTPSGLANLTMIMKGHAFKTMFTG